MRVKREKAKDGFQAYTAEEIADAVGLKADSIAGEKSELSLICEDLRKSSKVQFSETDFKPPIYNVWSFAKKTNEVQR